MTINEHHSSICFIKIVRFYFLGTYGASASLDGSWCFVDLSRGECIKQMFSEATSMTSLGANESRDIYSLCGGGDIDDKIASSYLTAKFHPDGLILGTGTLGDGIKLWDIRDQQLVATLKDHNAPINSLSFSENGYLLASAGGDGSVKLWDLRKLACMKSIERSSTLSIYLSIALLLYVCNCLLLHHFFPCYCRRTTVSSSSPATAVAFDKSGVYLAMAGGDGSKDLKTIVVKDYNNTLADYQGIQRKPITSICWGADASSIFSGSMDRSIKLLCSK